MKNLREKFGKFAISKKQSSSLIGGACPPSIMCDPNGGTNPPCLPHLQSTQGCIAVFGDNAQACIDYCVNGPGQG